jgi:hypothetical protein
MIGAVINRLTIDHEHPGQEILESIQEREKLVRRYVALRQILTPGEPPAVDTEEFWIPLHRPSK